MDIDNFRGFEIPQNLDLSGLVPTTSFELASEVQKQMEESMEVAQRFGQETFERRKRMQEAVEQTAANTGVTNEKLQRIIDNQNGYIELLQKQLAELTEQSETSKKQLEILKGIFASEEDGLAIENEIRQLIQDQIDSSHPLWDYVKDKGGDIAVSGILAGAPVIYTALKHFLASKGILLP